MISKADRGLLGGVMAIQWKGEVIRERLASSQDGVEVTLDAGEEILDVWVEELNGNAVPKEFDVSIRRQ
ncbi:MAG: hypothetical protein CBC31_003175 [Verrucomicrobia bacterium TMED71]|nr:MAG: hypothetical protein CBC31_003175 [Verrucomicrobia bacterium TMED71]